MLGNVIDSKLPTSIEDLFGNDFYLEKVNQTYASELKGKSLSIKTDGRSIVVRIVEGMAEQEIQFNKGRVAKRIIADLAKTNLTDLDKKTQENFTKVFASANKIMTKWTGEAFSTDAEALNSKVKVVKPKPTAQVSSLQ